MKAIGWIIAAIFVAGMLLAGCFALVHDDDNSMGPIHKSVLLAYHDGYDDGDCDWRGDCGDRDYSGGDYSSRDRNRNRGRDRGAFSPGPFRDSPVVICAPYSCNSGGEQSGGNRNDQPPPDEGGQP